MKSLRKIILVTAVLLGILGMVSTVSAVDDYFVYGVHNTGFSSTCAIDGYVIDSESGILYVADYSGVCHIYKVSIPSGSDPDTHPSNPYNTGTMAIRTFTTVGTHNFKADCGWEGDHHAEFYIGDNYIYYGPDDYGAGGIEKWAKNADGTFGTYLGKLFIPVPPTNGETFGYDAVNDIWYTCTRERVVYSFEVGVDTAWQQEFTYPSYGGGHHDGLEFVNGYLWISDMTSDYIGQWEYTGTGSYNGWDEVQRFSYTYGKSVEGMGFGPLGHFWVSSMSYEIYEIGGGKLGVALTDIPDQKICAGESFNTFDLDDYAGGATGLAWTYSGATVLTVSIDSVTHVCTVTYPSSWTGSETITFTATCPVGNVNSDDATFTVSPCIPEFPTMPSMTLSIVAILGMVLLISLRKRREE